MEGKKNRVDDTFWSSRIQVIMKNALPSIFHFLQETGRWDLMKMKIKEGSKPHYFWDSDIAKFLEALCYSMRYIDEGDELYLDFILWINEATKMIINLQQADGYINSYFTVVDPENKFKNITENHELYCAGHLLEAAIARYLVLGELDLLQCLERYLLLIYEKFGPYEGQMHGYPGHQELELAIGRLLDLRFDERLFNLLQYIIEQRGFGNGEFFDEQAWLRGVDPNIYIPGDSEGRPVWPAPRSYWYYQAETQIRDTKEAKGHAVRQTYYLAAVQILANLKKDDSLKVAVTRLWREIVDKHLYIHGGIGSVGQWEGFGKPYDLRWDCYSETCASVGLIFLCQSILKDRLDREVADVMERSLYNNVLGGVSLDGKSYFYDQPITGSKGLKRQSWFSCSCCPPNVARLFTNLQDYVSTAVDNFIAIHLYIGGTYEGRNYSLKIQSKYPYEGEVSIDLNTVQEKGVAIKAPKGAYSINVDDYQEINGYIILAPRVWNDQDITLSFEIDISIVQGSGKIEANKGHLAVEFGPFVYGLALSGIEGDVPLDALKMSRNVSFEKFLENEDDYFFWALVCELDGYKCKFVPYFFLGNEHPGEDFRIWLKDSDTQKDSEAPEYSFRVLEHDDEHQEEKPDSQINYGDAINYWSAVPASVDGVLGGFGERTSVPKADIVGSSTFLRKLRSRLDCPSGYEKLTLDVGAGIGRITRDFLWKVSDSCDLLEPVKPFVQQMTKQLEPVRASGKLGDIYEIGMQEWSCAENKIGRYWLIWCQWCVGQLPDEELVSFWMRCRKALIGNGIGTLIVKENIAPVEDIFDDTDSSVTRTDAKFRDLFARAHFKLIATDKQKGLPKGLYPVRMYCLKPT